MPRGKDGGKRFDFLDNVVAEPEDITGAPTAGPGQKPSPADPAPEKAESQPPAETQPSQHRMPAASPPEPVRPYLFQTFSRSEPLAPLGNRIRLPAKHHLEDYVRVLKRAGYPATESRILEALMLQLDDTEVRRRVTLYLVGTDVLMD